MDGEDAMWNSWLAGSSASRDGQTRGHPGHSVYAEDLVQLCINM